MVVLVYSQFRSWQQSAADIVAVRCEAPIANHLAIALKSSTTTATVDRTRRPLPMKRFVCNSASIVIPQSTISTQADWNRGRIQFYGAIRLIPTTHTHWRGNRSRERIINCVS